MTKKLMFIVFVSLVTQACVSGVNTRLKTSLNADAPRVRYQKMIVEVLNADGSHNVQGEWIFRDQLNGGAMKVVAASDLVPEFSKSSGEEKIALYQKANLRGLLRVKLSSMQSQRSYRGTERRTYLSRSRRGVAVANTYEYPSYSDSTTQTQQVSLYDLKLKKTVWVGSGQTYAGYASQDMSSFLASLAQEIIKKLIEDGLI